MRHEAFWMPYTPNRAFKAAPRLLARAEGVRCWTPEGREVLDGVSGLWCVGAGHRHPRIMAAVAAQALAERIAAVAPPGLDRVFLVNSGSEACDTAVKIALAFWRAQGQGQRTLLVGRERGFHGVGFGGISVGGMTANRRAFGAAMLRADHLRSTWDPATQAFVRGQPAAGAVVADRALRLDEAPRRERLVALHDASNIAAVFVEPVAGSTGVLVPPLGYLQRLRELCTRHGILLVFDEVITGFGRLGAMFGAQALGVVPDMILFAKTVSNGAAPLGGVIVRRQIHDALMHGPPHLAELMHGYTCSGHPLACAAGLAMLDVLAEEDLIGRVRALAPHFERTVHELASTPGVVSVRNLGLAFDLGVLTRAPGDTLVLAPPFVSTPAEIEQMAERLRAAIVQTHTEHPEGSS